MVPSQTHQARIDEEVAAIVAHKNRYLDVSPDIGCPWYFVGIIHLMECNLNFHTHLYNGDPLSARTVRYPRGRPLTSMPPFPWEFSASDAMKYQKLNKVTDWGITNILRLLESYNGHGYWSRDIYTPYLWSYTNHYVKGKFIEVLNRQTLHFDVRFDPNLVSGQIGAAPILQKLLTL